MKLKPNNSGFTILFAVLAAGALLIMALGIANIAYREVVLSSSARVAGHAFFAADSGAECALYWDGKGAFSPTGGTVSCLGIPTSINIIGTDLYNFEISDPGPPTRCVRVIVDKSYTNFPDNIRIESKGYNVECTNISGNPRAVERSIEILLD